MYLCADDFERDFEQAQITQDVERELEGNNL